MEIKAYRSNHFQSWHHYLGLHPLLLAPTSNHQVFSILPKEGLSMPSFRARSSASSNLSPYPFTPAEPINPTLSSRHLQASAKELFRTTDFTLSPMPPRPSPYLRIAFDLFRVVSAPRPWIQGPPGSWTLPTFPMICPVMPTGSCYNLCLNSRLWGTFSTCPHSLRKTALVYFKPKLKSLPLQNETSLTIPSHSFGIDLYSYRL